MFVRRITRTPLALATLATCVTLSAAEGRKGADIREGGSVEAQHCDRLLALLAEHESEAADSYSEAIRAEYCVLRSGLDDFQHRLSRPEALQQRKDVIGMFAANDRAGEFLQKISAMTDDDYAKEMDILNRIFGAILALEDQTALERLRQLKALNQEFESAFRETTLLNLLMPAVTRSTSAFQRSETTLRGTQCLVALRRWQLQHTQPPQDLETLSNRAGMRGVPIDAYSDQPLRMT